MYSTDIYYNERNYNCIAKMMCRSILNKTDKANLNVLINH